MPVYFVASQNIQDQAKLDEYLEKVGPTLTPDLKVLAIDPEPELIEGERAPRTVLLEFPDRDAFRRWYDSPEYKAISPLRQAAGPSTVVVADGFVPPSD